MTECAREGYYLRSHMLLWIIPSFVAETMTAEGRRLKTVRTGLKRNHTALGRTTLFQKSVLISVKERGGHYRHTFWDATRAFMLLSVLSCFAGVVLGLSAFSNRTKNTRVRTAGITLLLSGFFALLALAIYTGVTVNFFGKRYIEWRFSWSYILGWVGIILTITAGILQICGYKRSTAEPAPQNPTDSWISPDQ
ncbi:lens intrinsic membrane protein 2.2 isoform X1 [Ictalurus furcatus]|uniref:lens intrinsic membrane protein 2.2 isoform X1 n=1 Tax=Ictalurus furcatus TaxID=66913 RepID=UPI0023500E9C|nr:lens intrinsic membrane protein 2.2 isoform X1 [Ictalurus furcatus]